MNHNLKQQSHRLKVSWHLHTKGQPELIIVLFLERNGLDGYFKLVISQLNYTIWA